MIVGERDMTPGWATMAICTSDRLDNDLGIMFEDQHKSGFLTLWKSYSHIYSMLEQSDPVEDISL